MGFFKDFIDRLTLGNTIYFPDINTKVLVPNIESNYIRILEELKEDFIKIPENLCSGAPVINAGYMDDFAKLRDDNKLIFKSYGVKKIISNSPSCVEVLEKYYGYKAIHIVEVIHKHIHRIKPTGDGEQIVYHDSCVLGRKLGLYEQPREIVEALGYEVLEFENNRENSLCCGICGGLKANNPKMANDVAKRLLKKSPVKKLVTACPDCYIHFKENAPSDFEVFELSELILKNIDDSGTDDNFDDDTFDENDSMNDNDLEDYRYTQSNLKEYENDEGAVPKKSRYTDRYKTRKDIYKIIYD